MKREVQEFRNITTDLGEIAESPNFSDEMRNKASALQYYILNRKPEPIIVQSGDTFVASYEGIDYLCIDGAIPKRVNVCEINLHERRNPQGDINSFWKPFSEIEITDEIAKLRPVMHRNITPSKDLRKLYGVLSDRCTTKYVIHGDNGYNSQIADSIDWRLATVKDLSK